MSDVVQLRQLGIHDIPGTVSAYAFAMTARLNAIGIVVADMGRALAFYRALGLEIPPESEAEDHAEAALPGGLRLMWDTEESIRSFDPNWSTPTGSPRTGLAFVCESAAEVDRLYADLTGAGYAGQREPWDAFWGQRYATVGDPDGNGVDLFAWLPGREPSPEPGPPG